MSSHTLMQTNKIDETPVDFKRKSSKRDKKQAKKQEKAKAAEAASVAKKLYTGEWT